MNTFAVLQQSWAVAPVGASADLARILRLPVRHHDAMAIAQLQAAWTAYLKTPRGTEQLFPAQAMALAEIQAVGGLLGPIRVGGGKTLVSFLAFVVLNARRGILVTRANLVEKTRRDLQAAAAHWRVPFSIHIMSYEALGRESAAQELEVRSPDVIVLDECHRAKNQKAACTRRLRRYRDAHPETKFVNMSGTLVKSGVSDAAHLSAWALREGSPFPLSSETTREWASALDERVKPGTRKALGALKVLAGGSEDVEDVRRGFYARMVATPGVVSTAGETVDCSLVLSPLAARIGPGAQAHFKRLREEWINPDGIAIADPMQAWGLAQQLAMGFHYYLHPTPPEAWTVTRGAWAAYVRGVLSRARKLDTEKQVRTAVQRGELRDELRKPEILLREWEIQSAAYRGEKRVRWHDDGMIEAAATWIAANPSSLVWTWHSAFGRKLAARAGVPYVGSRGLLPDGRLVDDLKGSTTVVLSVGANTEGRNLQSWSRNLVTSPPTTQLVWEQLLGRTHRYGQTEDEVTCEVMIACREHARAIRRAHSGSRMTAQLMGASQKLLLASWTTYDTYEDSSYAFRPMSGSRYDDLDEYEWRPHDD